jgi:hypothetical protein
VWFVMMLALAADVGPGAVAGIRVSARAGGGVVDGDGVAVAELGVGVQTEALTLQLRAPLTVRVLDAPPTAPDGCRWWRCEEWGLGGDFDLAALARVVDEFRLGQASDAVQLRAGRLVATLGAGATVDRVTTAASWDRRTSGIWGSLRTPLAGLGATAFVANAVAPWELSALRLTFAPVPLVELAVEAAADARAPLDGVLADGAVTAVARTRLLASGVVEARVPVAVGDLVVAPRVELGATTGLADAAGFGGAVGLDVEATHGGLALQARSTIGFNGAGHRRGVFSTFYLVERRRVLVGGSTGIVDVEAPAGMVVDARVQASVLRTFSPLLRVHVEPATGANVVEAGATIATDALTLSATVLRRGWTQPAEIVDGDVVAHPLVLALEAGWRVWGPWSLTGRWFRLPRFREGGVDVTDDDVVVGVSYNVVLAP